MANLIREQRLVDNNKRALLKYVAMIDTAVANSTIVDASTLRYALNTSSQIMAANADPRVNYSTTIKRIHGNARANGYIKLQWQGATNTEIVTITNGRFDYNFDSMGDGAVITNTETSGNNGDILITVVTPSSADTLTLFIDLRKDGKDYDQGQTADPVAFNRGPGALA